MTKRVVVWGTGFVGRLVIPEILAHPTFDLVGVGVNSPEKVGKDVGELCGHAPIGLAATNDVDALVARCEDRVEALVREVLGIELRADLEGPGHATGSGEGPVPR